VRKWSSTWSWSRYGYLGVVLLTASAVSLAGCSKKKEEEAKATAEKAEAESNKKKPQGDRYADGKRLETALKDWTKRWADTADLPACDPLLKDASQLELCKTAASALTTMKAAVAKPEAEGVLLKNAAELALATENASEKLRTASMEKMQAEQKTAPASSGPTKVPQSAFSAIPKAKPLGSGALSKSAAGKLADKLKPAEAPPLDPAMQVMQAYSRVNRAALRYLSQFLQFGPLPTRKAAFGELEALSKKKEAWPALGRTLREAAMAENDPDLQGKLKALAPKLSRRAPGSGPAAAPPGHPPVPGAGTPKAPAAPAEKD
jgi:hypothetical protein